MLKEIAVQVFSICLMTTATLFPGYALYYDDNHDQYTEHRPHQCSSAHPSVRLVHYFAPFGVLPVHNWTSQNV